MSLSVTEGRLTLSLTRSSRLFEAWSVVRDILERFTESDQWDQTLTGTTQALFRHCERVTHCIAVAD